MDIVHLFTAEGQGIVELRQQDRTLWQKICDWFKDLEKEIRSVIDAYRGVEPDSKEGKMVAQMEDVLVILESLYADALVDASENFAGAQKNTDPEGGVKYSVERTQYMSWDDQVKGALYGGNNIRRNDTLVIAKPADTAVSNVINDVPLAIPLRVLTKASSGKDISHSIKRGKLAKLDQGIKNAPITTVNPDRNAVVFATNIVQGGLPVIVAFDMNAVFDGDKVHKATSIHLQGDTQAMLQNLSEKATVYVQKNELDPVGATNNLRGLAAKIKFIERVPQQDSNVKKKSSLRDTSMCQVDIGKIISGIQTTNTASLDRKLSGQFECVATADGNINSLPQSSHGILYCPLNFQSRPSHLRWWLLIHRRFAPASGNII